MASLEKNEQEFYWAIEAGKTKTVDAYLKEGYPVNRVYTKKHELTALHQASTCGKTEVVGVLLKYGANVNAQTAYKSTPLHEAAYHGHVRIVEILLNHDANIDVRNKHEETPLQIAFKNDQMEIIKILIKKGGKLNVKDRNDVTPLHWASHHGNRELVKRLLDISEIDVNGSDVNGWTPLFESACYSRIAVMELLLYNGANINLQDKMGWTTLHYAAANDRQAVIRTLLKHKADTSIRHKKNETAIQTACTNNKWNSVNILMDAGGNVNEKDTQGRTLLHRSSIYCQNDIVRALLHKGSDIDSVDEKGWTPLHCAIHSGQLAAVKLFLEKKADVNFADKEGCTPLYRAAVYGDTNIVNELLRHGANVSKANKKGWTPLHYAASYGKLNVVKSLIDEMSDLDIVDKEGLTPLHVAVKCGYPVVVKELLIRGAEIISTSSNKSPFELAEEEGRSDIVQVFKDFLADGLPLEIKLLDGQLADGFERSLRYGFYYSYVGKIMFVGNEAVGKTTITRLLLGKKPKKKRKPTEGIDMHVNRAAIDRETRQLIPKVLKFKDTAYSNMFMRKKDDVRQTNIRPLKKIVQQRTSDYDANTNITKTTLDTDTNQDIIKPTLDTDSNQDIVEPTIAANANQDIIEPTVDDDTNQALIESISDTDESQDNLSYCYQIPADDDDNEFSVSSMDSPVHYSRMKRAFSFKSLVGQPIRSPKERRDFSRKMLRLGARKASSKGIYKKKEAPVIILDFAGQEVFYSTHQSFLTHRGVYVIVINGSLKLDDVIESEVFIPGRHEKPTTRGYIKFWVNSILCYSKGKSQSFPKIIICCTHKDKIDERQIHEQRKYIYEEIDKMFSNSPANTHLIIQHKIFINAVDQKDPEIGILKTVLVETIMSQPTWGEKMPKSWIHLEMEINKKARDGDKILTMQKLRKLNKLNPAKVLTDEELDLFLRVHHSIGDLMYFPLPDLHGHIIISPSFIIDALKLIVTDKCFVKEKALDMWKSLNSEGKLPRNELLKMFENSADFKKYKEFLISLMCHLDMITEPRVFNPKTGVAERSDFFYVPCMVKGRGEENFQDQSLLSNSIGFSFKFNTSILPSAIGFRLIACCLDLGKVAEYNGQNLLFSGLVVVVYNKFIRLIVKVKDGRIDIFLTHTTSRFDIKAHTATSIHECLADILQRITDSYKILSSGSSDHATSSFQIEYTCYDVDSPCYCQERMEWTCRHGDRITQDILNKWSADRTITDIECSSDCKGISVSGVYKNQLTELHLGKLSLLFERENLTAVLLHLGIVTREIDEIECDNQGILDQKFLCLRKWRIKSKSCTFEDIYKVMEAESQDTHILCKVFRDKPLKTDIDLEKSPTDKQLHSIASNVIKESLLFCVLLGIKATNWLQLKADKNKIVDINENILKQWKEDHPGIPKLRELADALYNVGIHIDILLSDEA